MTMNIRVIIIFPEICFLTDLVLNLVMRYDSEHNLKRDEPVNRIILFAGMAAALWLTLFKPLWRIGEIFLAGIFFSYLLLASLVDIQTTQVYDFLHILGALAGLLLCLLNRTLSEMAASIVLFWLVQRFLFSRMYGKADAKAFWVCALFEAGTGGGLKVYFMHMAAALLLLSVVQVFRHNINNKGNLIVPVPFLPYISITVLLFL